MHEMAICESIRQIMEDQAREAGFARVERVRLAIGALSGVEIAALQFGFDVVMRGSVARTQSSKSRKCRAAPGACPVRGRSRLPRAMTLARIAGLSVAGYGW
jgi:Zn finger protein HypA/HybF involved in hydrogenase expression